MKIAITVIILLSVLLSSCTCAPQAQNSDTNVLSEYNSISPPEAITAMWVSQFDLSLLCTKDGKCQREKESYTSRVVLMMAKLRMMGFNTIFLQVRPNGDSLYPSALFGPSPYAVGSESAFSYDPIATIIEEAKNASISVHLWINPLRGMAVGSALADHTEYPIGRWIAKGAPFVRAVNGYYYLDPAYDEVRALIAEGAREALMRYPADGLHIDDYFYPTTDGDFDRLSYDAYQAEGGHASLGDFRRQNTALLVQSLCQTAHDCGVVFGVSPGGNLERNRNELYADVDEWCREKRIDYLCPQVYFGMVHETHPFSAVAHRFSDIVANTDIVLIIGMTLEKAANGYAGVGDPYAGSGAREWIEGRNVLLQCTEVARAVPHSVGVAYFSYRLFYSPDDGSDYLPTAEERKNLFPSFRK